jgi:hypothetical protein
LRSTMPFPAPSALMPILGTCAIIAASSHGYINRFLLSWRPLVTLGLISYPLYLWHWPIMALARIRIGDPSILLQLSLIVVSVILAAATYIFLERPIQRQKLGKTVPYLLPMMVIVGVSAGATMHFDVRTLWYPAQIRRVLGYSTYDYAGDARLPGCWLTEESGATDFPSECGFNISSKNPLKIAVWGDSHAARLYPGLRADAPDGVNIAQYTISSCPPSGNFKPYCAGMNEKILAKLQSGHPNVIVMFARWQAYSADWLSSDYSIALRRAVDAVKAMNSRVVLVGQFPEFPELLPDLLFDRWKRSGQPLPGRLSPPGKLSLAADEQLRQFAADNHIEYFSLINELCNDDGCLTAASDEPADLITWDYGHLTTNGSKLVARGLLDFIGNHDAQSVKAPAE